MPKSTPENDENIQDYDENVDYEEDDCEDDGSD